MEAIDYSFNVFQENKERLLKECRGKYVVIVGDEIKEKRYSSFPEALEDALKTHKFGEFVIQQVVDDSVRFVLT
ncbi:MAG: hypothetical protein OYH77_08055 [Pseudomonadota bacterium]|nr:hypothetical protein [Pseudomonadota bacterium]